ncbi:MAG: hypothetical protein ACTSXV_01920 [Alphaproteobacteria bacterium]
MIEQSPLFFTSPSDDFLISSENKEAVERITNFPWENSFLSLIGSKYSGKTTFCKKFAREREGIFVTGFQFAIMPKSLYIFEDIDLLFKKESLKNDSSLFTPQISELEKKFFSFYEQIQSKGSFLLLTATTPPAHWQIESDDLKSRFAILPTVRFENPKEDFAHRLLAKYFSDTGRNVPPEKINTLIQKEPQTYEALYKLAQKK